MPEPLLSVCIPTYGRTGILKNTLESIYSQGIDTDLFEVCISDNSPTDETEEMLSLSFSDRTNLRYSKSECEGYLNSVEALKLGTGKFLKLHNNYSEFRPGFLSRFMGRISESGLSLLFFSSGSLGIEKGCARYGDFDSFMRTVSYFSTWSTSFGIWRADFERLMSENIMLDKMFPHTSLLFGMTRKTDFCVDDTPYFNNQDVGRKGGYNLPETFGTRFLGMCRNLLDGKYISEETFGKVKKDTLRFIAEWYANVTWFKDKYTFSFACWENVVSSLYGKRGVAFMKCFLILETPRSLLKKLLKKY